MLLRNECFPRMALQGPTHIPGHVVFSFSPLNARASACFTTCYHVVDETSLTYHSAALSVLITQKTLFVLSVLQM